jgi:hypothetical protein
VSEARDEPETKSFDAGAIKPAERARFFAVSI